MHEAVEPCFNNGNMWLFTRYGFFSVACASEPGGALDADTLMIRARSKAHLQRLQLRFPAIGDTEIITTPNTDYRYRIVVPKSAWANTIAELATEQTWSNFKNEVARFGGRNEYEQALHEIWLIMHRLQRGETEERSREQAEYADFVSRVDLRRKK